MSNALLFVALTALIGSCAIAADESASANNPKTYSVVGEWSATHPHWSHSIVLSHDGTFTRGGKALDGGEDKGKWTLASFEGTPLLVLLWDNWGPDSLLMVGPNFFRGQVAKGSFMEMRRDSIDPASIQSAVANTDSEAQQKITAFLLSGAASGDHGTALLYNDLTDAYNTKITFAPSNEFRRSDGVRGMWQFEDGKLVLKGLDTEGFTIVFDPQSLTTNELRGRITEGRWKNNKILLRLLLPSEAEDTAQD